MVNRLISEKSPYLLQHAYNPVDWHPWNEDAFELARREDKPVFLSVGYSTCHWCHVMAHESFEDPEVASLMNEAFVCIKVDREERPDIDQIYMAAAMGMTGRGGWPLTIIMTPEKKPFFAGTYIPKKGRFGQAGMLDLIPRIKDLWDRNRDELLGSADKVTDYLRQAEIPQAHGAKLDASTLDKAFEELAGIFDMQNGGFGTAPKFPAPHNLLFLLRYWRRSGNPHALEMVERTLQAMRSGGICDHVGFGFHRYSTDAQWFVPHFEKMLYDQAMLVMAFSEAYQATGKKEYASAINEILQYVHRDMASPEGGFYSAQDADSEGEEGRFYLWTAKELKAVLEKEEFGLLIRLFDVHELGNFEKGKNILRLVSSLEDAAGVMGIKEADLRDRLEKCRIKLLAAREKRVRPLRDDKILADWNGLMMSAYCRAAQSLHEPSYAEKAKGAADFILEKMRTSEGRLWHRYKNGASIQANLDDYAFLVSGLIDLYETIFDIKYLKAALELNKVLLEHFWDEGSGGLFFAPDDGEQLLVRKKEAYDGAIPCGNSVSMLNFLRLSHLTGDPDLEDKALSIGRAFAAMIDSRPIGHSMLLCALDFALGPSSEVVLVGEPGEEGIRAMLKEIYSRFLPNKTVVAAPENEINNMSDMIKTMQLLSRLDGKPTAYVCSGHICHLPVNDPKMILDLLEKAA
jgi:uncharacterized protein YyaL (SSP411 family)